MGIDENIAVNPENAQIYCFIYFISKVISWSKVEESIE